MKILKDNFKRLAAVLLCAAVLLGAFPLTPGLLPTAKAASWATPYVDQLQQWGIMQGVGNGEMNEGGTLTRAGMVAMLNRAFGFTRTSPIPFTDVRRQDWFYDDVVTSYAEGIVNGTSASTFSPKDPVTREQALVFLARCLRLEESPGEITEFTDGRQFSSWAAPYVRSAMLAGIISGGTDGSFQPGRSITRGEMAKMLATGLGNLINVSGTYSEGGVFGNLTINTQGVTLKDTTIAGDLYLTGGVGLGDVVLDNVKVLGRIVVAGGGESEDGEASILLNNVEAHKMLIDPATGQYVSIRAIGSTDIPETQVTSNSYIQDDVRIPSKGLREVFLNADEGTQFTVAGNMKNVINQTPGSTLVVGDTGDGSVTSITVDEKAVGSTLQVEINAAIDEVNLDTATKVTGSGDIGNLVVNTNGSVIDILPDRVVVRPGVITEIAGIPDVDSEKAKELSDNPRLLEGFPKVRNVAPTSADAVFSTNKAGTLYWALTTAAVGPLNDRYAESLISPSYGSGFLASGNMPIATSKTEYTTSLTDLAEGGTYYISAMLVDAHGRRSPVKAQEIITPDGSVPAFAKDFPTITDRTPSRNSLNAERPYFELVDVQATVMATKSCDLYYVLLPSGSSEPSTAEFLSHAFVDPLGYGRLRLIKNAMDSFKVNQVDMDLDGASERLGELEESTEYDLYVWLTDADGTQSSNITKVTFTTKDITPPKFNMDTMQTGTQATSVKLSNSINEDGTVYWVALPAGTQYPMDKDNAASEADNLLYHQMQIINGMTGTEKGKSGKVTAKKDAEFNISITGLEKESEYDVYFVAVDAAGNASDVQKFIVHTLDESPPKPRQEFTSYPEDSPETPYANSDIHIVFNETIRYRQPTNSALKFDTLKLHEMYDNANNQSASEEERQTAHNQLIAALRDMIVLYDATANKPVPVKGDADADEDWVFNYDNVVIYREENGELVISFPYNADPEKSATNLQSGARYYFQLMNIADNSERHNVLGTTKLPEFTTVSAQMHVERFDGDLFIDADQNSTGEEHPTDMEVHMAFTVDPRSTSTASDSAFWDMLLWFDNTCTFELYTRVQDPNNRDRNKEWSLITGPNGEMTQTVTVASNQTMNYASLIKQLGGGRFRQINLNYDEESHSINGGFNDDDGMIYEYAIRVTELAGSNDPTTFSKLLSGRVTFISGTYADLGLHTTLDDVNGVANRGITNITDPLNYGLTKQFIDGRAPQYREKFPRFTPTSSGVTMFFQLDRPGDVYYVLAPVRYSEDDATKDHPLPVVPPSLDGSVLSDETLKNNIQLDGSKQTLSTATDTPEGYRFDFPDYVTISNPRGTTLIGPEVTYGSIFVGGDEGRQEVAGLSPETEYYVYLVTKGTTDIYSDVKVYKFTTSEVSRPIITLNRNNSDVTITSSLPADVNYLVLADTGTSMPSVLTTAFADVMDDDAKKQLKEKYGAKADDYLREKDEIIDGETKKKFTVLDALMEDVAGNTTNTSAGCLFDLYATKNYKSQLASFIRNAASGAAGSGNAGAGVENIPTANGNKLVDCNKKDDKGESLLKPATNYYFLAVGNTPPDSDDGFRAIYPVILVDNEAPKIASLQNNLYYERDVFTGAEYIRGSLIINFDERLYTYDGASAPRPVVGPNATPTPVPNGDTVSISTIVYMGDTGISIEQPTTQTDVRQVIFKFDGVSGRGSTTITFDSYLSDGNQQRRTDNPLVITVRARKQDANDQTVTVTIPTAWDGRATITE